MRHGCRSTPCYLQNTRDALALSVGSSLPVPLVNSMASPSSSELCRFLFKSSSTLSESLFPFGITLL